MEREAAKVPEEDFTFNAQTKMYQVSMDGYYYTFGCIFEDDQGRKLFWCRKAANEFRREKFYKLADEEDTDSAHVEFKKGIDRI